MKMLFLPALALLACHGRSSTNANVQDDQNGGATNVGTPCYAARIQTGANPVNDYAPVDQTTSTSCGAYRAWFLMSGDNEGSFITGLSVGQQLGDVHLVCNQGAQVDASTLVFRYEDANSDPGNRFDTPNRGDYIVGVDTCVEISYEATTTANCGPSCARGGNRWVIHGAGHAASMLVDSLQIMGTITATSVSGTLSDWAPVGDGAEAYPSGFCLAGNSCQFRDNTVVRVQTADATGVTITGLQWEGVASVAGQGPVKALVNYGPGPMTLTNIDARSAIGNQFALPGGIDLVCPYYASILVYHANVDGGWMVLASDGCYSTTTMAETATVSGMLTTPAIVVGPAAPIALLAPGTTGDWNATGCVPSSSHCVPTSSVVRARTTGVATSIVTGMLAPGGGWYPGFRETICNYGPGVIQLTHNDHQSTAGNRFFLAATVSGNTTLTIQYGQCQSFIYDDDGVWMPIDGSGASDHPAHNGATPAVSTCGTNPSSVYGDDAAGYFTIGSQATGCTLTFANPWNYYNANHVHCTVTNRNGVPFSYAPNNATLVLVNIGDLSNTVVDYACAQ